LRENFQNPALPAYGAHMKSLAICLGLCLVPAAALAADASGEMAKLKGKWQLVSMEMRGMKLPVESLGPVKMAVLELGDGKLAIRVGDKAIHEGSFRIDASDSPKTIEGALLASPARGRNEKSAVGIYEVQGDTLRICFGTPGGQAPREFSSTAAGSTLNTYRRVK
jgi:hypothetical protein